MDTTKTRKNIGFPKKEDWCKFTAIFTKNSLIIAGHSVMESWETNYMKMLASIVTKNGGNILEVGFGLGIATHFIRQYHTVKNHVIVEFHPDIIKNCKKIYSSEIKSGKIKLLKGFWEGIVQKLTDETFDGILFDTYPLSEEQIHKNHFWFFKEAHRLLKKNGVLTYYSDESKNFSKEHITKLKEVGFRKIDFKICKVHPPKNCMYWDKKTILAPIIIK